MNILFLFCSLTNLESESGTYCNLINEFARQGHHVMVSAKGRVISKTQMVKENGVDVLRIKSHDFTRVSNPIKKALAYQEYVIKQLYYTKKFFSKEKVDLIFSHSIPPELAYVAMGLKKKFDCKFYIHQSDFTWQDAVAFGYFGKKSPVALYYRYWERKAFKLADYIGCPTEGTGEFIRKEYPQLPKERFHFIPYCQRDLTVEPNWEIRKLYGLEGKFVCVYGGSVGAAQRIEHMVELAELCQEYDDIRFVLLGRGNYLDTIKQMVKEKHLKNFVFIDFMPQEQYLRFLATCDTGLIILNEKTGSPNFPSKTMSYLSMGIPVLAAVDYVTDFGRFLEDNNAGLWAYSDNPAALKEKLLKYYQSDIFRNEVKKNGRNVYEELMTPEKVYKSIIKSL